MWRTILVAFARLGTGNAHGARGRESCLLAAQTAFFRLPMRARQTNRGMVKAKP